MVEGERYVPFIRALLPICVCSANAEMRECEIHHTYHSRSFVATIACFDQASLLVRPRWLLTDSFHTRS